MKKFFSPIPDGGFPIYSQEINSVLQEELWTPLQDQMTALCDPLAGLIVSGGIINDLGSTFDIGAGICFLDGEYLEFDAQTGLTSPAYIKVDTPVTTNTAYADAVSRGYTVLNKALVVDADPGGQKIIINKDDTDFLYFRNYIAKLQDVNNINDDRSNERRSRPDLVAQVSSGGTMTVLYSKSGTWTATSAGTGIYTIKKDAAIVPNLPVIVTALNNSFSAGIATAYDEDNGQVIMQNTSGALTNWAFTIVAYPAT